MLKKLSLLLVILTMLFSLAVVADEGMWPLNNLEQLPWAEMKAKGLTLDPEDIYNPNGTALAEAIVQIGGGTGSFVSKNGLIITNHHVAFNAIQSQSSAQSDYITKGFLAKTMAEEIPAKGYRARITTGFEDVTKEVLSVVNDKMSYEERYQVIERRKLEIEKEAEKDKDITATVVEMLSGSHYYLFTYLELKDVRIVYAPPRSVGEFGGEIDNWMWPRHTGDFSFMRAYLGADGKPADYSEKNVPYQPKTYLKISTAGIQEGAFTMAIGYPGNTFRYRSSYSINTWQNENFPSQIDFFELAIKTYEEVAGSDRDLQIKFADDIKGLSNGLKNNQGMLKGLKKSQLLTRKQKQEAELTKFLQQNPDLQKKYGHVLPEIEKIYQDLATYNIKQSVLGYLNNVTLLGFASFVYRWSQEKEKNELEREPGFDNRTVERVKENFKLAQDELYLPADKKLMENLVSYALDLPEGQRIAAIEKIVAGTPKSERKKAIHEFVEKLFAGTQMGDLEVRMKMFDMAAVELANRGDSMIKFAEELEQERKPIQKKYDAFVGAIYKLRPELIRAMYKMKTSSLYPDANGTIRLAYGYVKGYAPADAVYYDWKTKLSGVIEKDQGKEPFDVPKELIEIYQKKDFGNYYDPQIQDVPVNFLHDLDSTGGNSGSPVLNGTGEIIGLLFDGNYEAMTSDFQFDPELTRAISVDIRYVLFITEKLNKATNVLKELGFDSKGTL